ncbi:hypothetical protein [Ekhidna sp.]|uniref:hypothetical protein n=1 Tax=Ekhidna sp. TaxID=2608089 RepID=UPI00329A7286
MHQLSRVGNCANLLSVRLIRVISVNNDQEFEHMHLQELKRVFLKYKSEDVRGGKFNLIHPESHWRMVELINWN